MLVRTHRLDPNVFPLHVVVRRCTEPFAAPVDDFIFIIEPTIVVGLNPMTLPCWSRSMNQ